MRIRLPFYLKQPQFPVESTVFRKSNGESKVLSLVMRNTYQGETDQMSKELLERLAVALAHDTVSIEGDAIFSNVTLEGSLQIEWVDFLDYQKGKGTFTVNVTPYDVSNSNCQSCQEASQLSLVDDSLGTYGDGEAFSQSVVGNDSICCFPATFELTWFNTDYVASASIDTDGVLSVVLVDPVPSINGVKIATYRVTCPDGAYDEADVYVNLDGTGDVCEPPANLQITDITDTGATMTFDDPGGAYFFAYWLYTCEDLSTPVHNAVISTNSVTWDDLESGQCYKLVIHRVCNDISSENVEVEFTTTAPSELCGRFQITADDGTLGSDQYQYSYTNCSGALTSAHLANLAVTTKCMMMDSFNNPIYFAAIGPVSYQYIEPC